MIVVEEEKAEEISDTPVLEKMSPNEIAAKLREMDDPETAEAIEEALTRTRFLLPPSLDDIWMRIRWPGERRLFLHTTPPLRLHTVEQTGNRGDSYPGCRQCRT